MGKLLNSSEIVDFAVYIEKNGYKFYVEALKKLNDPKIVQLFQYLADEEFRHERVFTELKLKVGDFTPPESYAGEYEQYMRDFLKNHALANDETLQTALDNLATVNDAVRTALEFEKDSIVLFSALKKYVDEDNKDIVESIIEEELTHIIKINNFKQDLKGAY